MTRSANGRFELLRIARGAARIACTAARDRPTCWRSEVSAPTVASARTMREEDAARPRTSSSSAATQTSTFTTLRIQSAADGEQDDADGRA